MPIVNLNKIKWIKKVWGKFMIYYFLIAFSCLFFQYGIYFYHDLRFFVKVLMNLMIGGFFGHGILINIDYFLAISQRLCKKYERDINHEHSFESGCNVCGDSSCIKEPYISREPWSNLMVDCRLDYAIQEFYETILNNFIVDWYISHSNKCEFIDEIKAVLKYSSAKLFRRIHNIHFGKLITHKLIPYGLQHFEIFYRLKQTLKYDELLEDAVINSPLVTKLHPAVSNRKSELEYLRNITTALMPLLLRPQDLDNRIFSTFIRELFTRWVLLPLVDLLADPKTINILLILLTDGKKMIEIEKEPSIKTEFLHKFTKDGPSHRHRHKSLKINVRSIIKDPTHLYTFMQFMKNNSKLHLLQFCLDIDGFNDKLLSPELNNDDRLALYDKANYIYNTYFQIDSPSAINFADDTVMELHEILKGGSANIVQLQTSQTVFEAYEHAYNLLQNEWAPKFYHSKEFYSEFLCRRNESEITSQNSQSASKVSYRSKDKLKTTFVNDDIKMYLDPTKGVDLSTMDVTIKEIFYRTQVDCVSDIIYVINIQNKLKDKRCNWVVERKESEFYVLQGKLIEIYGEQTFKGYFFPSNRSNIPNDFIKIKFELFLQYLVKHEILYNDNLVCLFLTDGDVSFIKQRESYPISKYGNKSQSPSSKAQMQKLEFLRPFLNNFFEIVNTNEEDDKEFQKIKDKNIDEIKETLENLNKDMHEVIITDGIFKNNFNLQEINMEDTIPNKDKSKTLETIKGFYDCVVYLMIAVFELPSYVSFIIRSIPLKFRKVIDTAFDNYLNRYLCDVFCEPRLAYLISLGHDLLFTDKSLTNKMTPNEYKIKAKEQLHSCMPSYLLAFIGDSFFVPIDGAFELVQSPQLNKQLVLSLFGILINELFPEVANNELNI